MCEGVSVSVCVCVCVFVCAVGGQLPDLIRLGEFRRVGATARVETCARGCLLACLFVVCLRAWCVCAWVRLCVCAFV